MYHQSKLFASAFDNMEKRCERESESRNLAEQDAERADKSFAELFKQFDESKNHLESVRIELEKARATIREFESEERASSRGVSPRLCRTISTTSTPARAPGVNTNMTTVNVATNSIKKDTSKSDESADMKLEDRTTSVMKEQTEADVSNVSSAIAIAPVISAPIGKSNSSPWPAPKSISAPAAGDVMCSPPAKSKSMSSACNMETPNRLERTRSLHGPNESPTMIRSPDVVRRNRRGPNSQSLQSSDDGVLMGSVQLVRNTPDFGEKMSKHATFS